MKKFNTLRSGQFWVRVGFILLAILGVLDAGYLSYEHFSQRVPPCSNSYFVDCGRVLSSSFAEFGIIPLAVFGLFYYLTLLYVGLIRYHFEVEENRFRKIRSVWNVVHRNLPMARNTSAREALFFVQLFVTTLGVLFSIYLVYLQVWVIAAVCVACMISASLSFVLWMASMVELRKTIE